VHLHAAVGRKSQGALAYAGHVLSAVTHYTAEVVVDEVPGTLIERRPDPAAHGLSTLRFGGTGPACGVPQAGHLA